MAVSSFQGIREKVRRAIRDTYGLLWDDTALNAIINEAQREYSILSGSLISSFEVTQSENDILNAPDDFIAPVKFIGADNIEKPFLSWKRLHDSYPNFRKITGTSPQYVVVDFDGERKFRLFPKVPTGTFAGTFYYKRLASAGKLETINLDAIENHCLFQVFLLDGKSSASTYYDNFVAAINKEAHLQRGLRHKSVARHGRYF